jgi:hypothetical protein
MLPGLMREVLISSLYIAIDNHCLLFVQDNIFKFTLKLFHLTFECAANVERSQNKMSESISSNVQRSAKPHSSIRVHSTKC